MKKLFTLLIMCLLTVNVYADSSYVIEKGDTDDTVKITKTDVSVVQTTIAELRSRKQALQSMKQRPQRELQRLNSEIDKIDAQILEAKNGGVTEPTTEPTTEEVVGK